VLWPRSLLFCWSTCRCQGTPAIVVALERLPHPAAPNAKERPSHRAGGWESQGSRELDLRPRCNGAERAGGRGCCLERYTGSEAALAPTWQALLQRRWLPRWVIQAQVALETAWWPRSLLFCWSTYRCQRTPAAIVVFQKRPHPPIPVAAKARWLWLLQLSRYSHRPAPKKRLDSQSPSNYSYHAQGG
jgi:hypothetical protein